MGDGLIVGIGVGRGVGIGLGRCVANNSNTVNGIIKGERKKNTAIHLMRTHLAITK
jgi:hypothetical protein